MARVQRRQLQARRVDAPSSSIRPLGVDGKAGEAVEQGNGVRGVRGHDADRLARLNLEADVAQRGVARRPRSAGRPGPGASASHARSWLVASQAAWRCGRLRRGPEPTSRRPLVRRRIGPMRNCVSPRAAIRSPTLISPSAASRPPTRATRARKAPVSARLSPW